MKLKPVHAGAKLIVLAALVLIISACSNDWQGETSNAAGRTGKDR